MLMMRIRKATVRDIQDLLECQARVWESLKDVLPIPWIEDEIKRSHHPDVKDILRKIITDQTRITLVAEENHTIVGFALGRTDKGGLSWLGFMGVRPTHRRQGIGRKLVQAYLTESKIKGAQKVSLNTAPMLKPAVKLYVDMGFMFEGLMKRHRYGVDLIIFSRFLE
jgi:ribosomal protein S18 acetylase RimI-like enzyme